MESRRPSGCRRNYCQALSNLAVLDGRPGQVAVMPVVKRAGRLLRNVQRIELSSLRESSIVLTQAH